VVIPIKAPAPWLRLALDSIAQQSFKPLETICVVDGYDPELISELQRREDVKVLVNDQSEGPAYARNRGIHEATGDYIALLDSDDEWEPTHLQALTSALLDDPGILVVGTRAYKVDKDEQPLGLVGGSHRASRLQLLIRNQFVNSGILFRREAALNVGCLNTVVRVCEDYDLWLRLAANGHVRMISGAPTVKYRVTSSGVSREKINQSSRDAIRISRRKLASSMRIPRVVPDFFQWCWERYLKMTSPNGDPRHTSGRNNEIS
jgi:glycosyltransferase involved in cell wall biosynthesis